MHANVLVNLELLLLIDRNTVPLILSHEHAVMVSKKLTTLCRCVVAMIVNKIAFNITVYNAIYIYIYILLYNILV